MAAWLSSFLSRTNPPPPQANSIEPFNDSRANQDRLSSTMARQPGPELTQHLLPNMPSLFVTGGSSVYSMHAYIVIGS
ncbi:hypothetical protein HBI64_211800 [Parastagonospora nodorum]|nr:hypothetical protein HBI64_211800 [Parastagonospora nodorum]